MEKLNKLRAQLDQFDREIAQLLNARMELIDQIHTEKEVLHLPITIPVREREVLDNVQKIAIHPILKEKIAEIYQTILKESKIEQAFYNTRDFPFKHVGIIGTGLMGGSICKALKTKKKDVEIRALAYPSTDQEDALAEGWIDQISDTLPDLVHFADLLILACPISDVIPLAKGIAHAAKGSAKKLIVVDVASVKEALVAAYGKLGSQWVEFIGTHPMAGKEVSGFSHSEATLFVEAPWVITPHEKNTSEGLSAIAQCVSFMGARPIFLEAARHDREACLISHLPGLLAEAYYEFVIQQDPESLQIAGPGFRSFSRLAHDNREMRAEIIHYNTEPLEEFLTGWIEYLHTKHPASKENWLLY